MTVKYVICTVPPTTPPPPPGRLGNTGNSFEIYKIKVAETSTFYCPSNVSLFLYCF